ncbi:TnsA-like heteromeric transposase endonuclease subunit [Streptosporangium sp. NPDC051023]|uniref:TnsA-like heteromeric transposase endonuclease subunit n=1 Tax=Streptosporangium sp. NPDC051023 TaxID=3155410 RepID=UPI00344E9454
MGADALVTTGGRSQFELCFLDQDGTKVQAAAERCWNHPFELASPVRKFPSFKGQKNFTGLWWSSTVRGHVGFESWLERDHVMALDFDPHVVGISSQPFQLLWHDGVRKRTHTPDYFARLADGTGLVIDVRPDDRITPEDTGAFAATRRLCEEAGWTFRRVGDLAPILKANIRWLAGYRHPRCLRADAADCLLQIFIRPTPLSVGVLRAGSPIAMLPSLFHLMWSQRLVTDLTSRPLDSESVIRTSRGADR